MKKFLFTLVLALTIQIVNAQDLFSAARENNIAKIEQLITNGAEINAANERGYTPLILAAYNNRVQKIAEICEKHNANLLIVGSHGHKGVKDFVFGETINKLRHEVNIPVFIAQ